MGGRRLVVAGILVRGDEVLAARRSYPASLAGKWEFPGGKVEPGESPQGALARELREELAAEVAVGEQIPGLWPINDSLEMRAYWCRGDVAASRGNSHDLVRWVRWQELTGLDWLPADVELAALVADRVRVGL